MNEIVNNKVNLCDSCSQVYPDCTSKPENVYFGDGIGHDNICACSKYQPKMCGDGDTISRQAAIDAISCDITVTGRQNAEIVAATIGTFADRIKALPSKQPQPCKDAVSKADVLETYAELYDVFDDNKEIKNELHKIYDKINALQAAQLEIIRCRECKHYYYDNHIPQEQMCVCDLDRDRWSPDSYCSFAERKEDE